MSKNIIDNLDSDIKQLVIDNLAKGTSQRKISELLYSKGVNISDISIGRWWRENKNKYENNIAIDDDIEVDVIINEMINKFDLSTIENEETKQRLLSQKLLRELMLFYIIDIHRQTKLKQQNLLNHYPTDLISSLKVISELYIKLKDENKKLKYEYDYLEKLDNNEHDFKY